IAGHAVGRAVVIEVAELVDDRSVAVAVDRVALLVRAGMDRRVARRAVQRIGGAVAVLVVIDAGGRAIAVQVVELIDQRAVAVAVDRVARLVGAGMDRRIAGRAVLCVGGAVGVLVAVYAGGA